MTLAIGGQKHAVRASKPIKETLNIHQYRKFSARAGVGKHAFQCRDTTAAIRKRKEKLLRAVRSTITQPVKDTPLQNIHPTSEKQDNVEEMKAVEQAGETISRMSPAASQVTTREMDALLGLLMLKKTIVKSKACEQVSGGEGNAMLVD